MGRAWDFLRSASGVGQNGWGRGRQGRYDCCYKSRATLARWAVKAHDVILGINSDKNCRRTCAPDTDESFESIFFIFSASHDKPCR